MPESNLEQEYRKLGFLHIPGVLTLEEVQKTRDALKRQFHNPNERELFPRDCFQIPEVYLLPFREKIITALKGVLGEHFCMIPDLNVHRNIMPRSGWHEDCGYEGPERYLMDPQFRQIKCGVYLQNNTSEWAGGIDIVPGGHTFPIKTPFLALNFRIKNFVHRFLGSRFRRCTVPIRAGDLVAFDSRLPHCATRAANFKNSQFGPGNIITNFPDNKTKLVIYWNTTRTDEAGCNYLRKAAGRALRKEFPFPAKPRFFMDFIRFAFPDDYPPDFVAQVERWGLAIAKLPPDELQEWKRRWNK